MTANEFDSGLPFLDPIPGESRRADRFSDKGRNPDRNTWIQRLRQCFTSRTRRAFTLTQCLILLGTVAWAYGAYAGFRIVWSYENTPGNPGTPSSGWPRASRLSLAADRPTLVMLIHPRCPCTRASLDELAEIIARCPNRVAAYVVFVRPAEMPPGWERDDLWRQAGAIPGVHLVSDGGGIEAARFHADTSGHTLLYAANGRLLFSGGITASRGHAGESAGQNAIISLIDSGRAERTTTFVYGCPLGNPRCAASRGR